MLLGEELVLLLLDDDKGTWLVPERAVRTSLRVALMVELLARRAVAVDDQGVLVPGLAAATGGDSVLEAAARQVVGHRPAELAEPDREELGRVLRRLREHGVLRRALLRRSRHLPRNHHPEAAVRARLLETLQVDLRPDRHTAMLVAIVHELDLLGSLFPGRDIAALRRRAAQIADQLRTDQHYFQTSLEQDRRDGGSDSWGMSSTLDALEGLSNLGDAVRVVAIPIKAVAKVLEDLP